MKTWEIAGMGGKKITMMLPESIKDEEYLQKLARKGKLDTFDSFAAHRQAKEAKKKSKNPLKPATKAKLKKEAKKMGK